LFVITSPFGILIKITDDPLASRPRSRIAIRHLLVGFCSMGVVVCALAVSHPDTSYVAIMGMVTV
jgi:hypothetical protein